MRRVRERKELKEALEGEGELVEREDGEGVEGLDEMAGEGEGKVGGSEGDDEWQDLGDTKGEDKREKTADGGQTAEGEVKEGPDKNGFVDVEL